jgi:cytoskeletal protein CcmA (bactofilin family)
VSTISDVNVNGALNVVGNTNVTILTATGATTLNNVFTVNGAATVNNTLSVSSALNAAASLDVGGVTTLRANLSVATGAVIGTTLSTGTTLSVGTTSLLRGDVSTLANMSIGGQLLAAQSTILSGTLNVSGAVTFENELTVNGPLIMPSSYGTLAGATFIHDVGIGGALTVAKATTLNSTVYVSRATTLNDVLTVAKVATLNDTLTVAKATTLNDTLYVSSTATLNDTLTVAKATTLQSTLQVQGATTLDATLFVNQLTTLHGDATMDADLHVKGSANISTLLNVAGSTLIGGALTVGGAVTFSNNLTVQGNLFVNGTTTALETSTLQVKDNGILIAEGNTTDVLQSGIMVQYQPTDSIEPLYAGIKRQPVTGEFIFFKDAANQISQAPTSIAPYIYLPLEGDDADVKGNSLITANGTVTYAAGTVGANSARFLNTAGGTATKYLRGSWEGAPEYTVSFWFYLEEAEVTQVLWSADNDTTVIYINPNDQLTAKMTSDGSSYVFGSSARLFPSEWHYVTFVFQTEGLCSLYLNHNLVSSTTHSGDQGMSSGSFGVGTYDVSTTHALRGRVDDLRIYHAVLSSQAASLEVFLDVYAAIMADSFTSASDQRLKKNIVTLNGALDNLQTLRGVYHDWNDPNQSADRQIGVIAQEVQEIYPELVTVGGNGFLSVNYPKLTAVLLQSIKELHVKHNQDIQELKEMIQALSVSPSASPPASPSASASSSPSASPRSHSSHGSHGSHGSRHPAVSHKKKHTSHNKTSKSAHASS